MHYKINDVQLIQNLKRQIMIKEIEHVHHGFKSQIEKHTVFIELEKNCIYRNSLNHTGRKLDARKEDPLLNTLRYSFCHNEQSTSQLRQIKVEEHKFSTAVLILRGPSRF